VGGAEKQHPPVEVVHPGEWGVLAETVLQAVAVGDERRPPHAANDTVGCALRWTPGYEQKQSATAPIPCVGVTAGRYGGVCARIDSCQESGTGGLSRLLGSMYAGECVGITTVPASVTTCFTASTTAGGPPQTHPNDESDA
jgi:hypothetical protein